MAFNVRIFLFSIADLSCGLFHLCVSSFLTIIIAHQAFEPVCLLDIVQLLHYAYHLIHPSLKILQVLTIQVSLAGGIIHRCYYFLIYCI